VICTHPGENATCVKEGAVATTTTTNATSTPKTCAECFRSLLTPTQLSMFFPGGDRERLCVLLEAGIGTIEDIFRQDLINAGVSPTVADQLIQCLKNVGVVFE
jgi:hypothetical protein